MMKFDNTASNIIVDISGKVDLNTEKVANIIGATFQSVKDIMQDYEPGVIKLDYFGKFTYSKRYREKKLNLTKNHETDS